MEEKEKEKLVEIAEKKSIGEEIKDWIEVAVPFNSIVNILANHWYKDE